MRNRSLHESLRAFAEEAAFCLSADAEQAADLPFEVVASPGARTPLYCYRPLTGEFIRDRVETLERLPSRPSAAAHLRGLAGVDDYLHVRGQASIPTDPQQRADAALHAFLFAMYAERTDFEFTSERFERAYAELEAAVYERRSLTAVIAPVTGLSLASEEVALDADLSLVCGDRLEGAPPEAVWARRGGSPEEPNVLALLTLERGDEPADPVEVARGRFERLLTALRLADAGGFALGPIGWTRTDTGAWRLVALGGGAGVEVDRPPYRVEPEEEDELRAFCNLVARRIESAPPAPLRWALTRFEAGCERSDCLAALTDHLLALRALLEPEGPGSGRMAQRLAAICALPEEREALARRAAHAISLERAVVAGLPPADPAPERLVDDLAHHLRSLLRDVLCGHLDADLVGVADGLLAEAVTGEAAALADTAEGPALDRATAASG